MNVQHTPVLPEEDIDIASLNLSGERVIVGYSCGNEDPSVVIQHDKAEPIYMSPIEARLLIAALGSAIERCGAV